jgi:hypothetical protein
MSERLPNVNPGFNATKEESHDLQLDPATIDSIVNQVEDKPLVFSTPLGDITILNSKRDSLRNIIRSNPLKPALRITYQTVGDCGNADAITIESVSEQMTGTTGINLTAFGFGVEIKARAVVVGEVIKEMPCQQKGDVQRVRNFLIDWYLDVSIAPGGSNTQHVKRYEQAVSTPCCTKKAPVEKPPKETPEKDGGGWLG